MGLFNKSKKTEPIIDCPYDYYSLNDNIGRLRREVYIFKNDLKKELEKQKKELEEQNIEIVELATTIKNPQYPGLINEKVNEIHKDVHLLKKDIEYKKELINYLDGNLEKFIDQAIEDIKETQCELEKAVIKMNNVLNGLERRIDKIEEKK